MGLTFWKQEDKKSTRQIRKKQQEDAAKAITTIIESGYSSHHRIYRVNFVRGIFFGLGSALGATFVLGAVLWVLSLFGELPIFGGIVETIQNTIDANR